MENVIKFCRFGIVFKVEIGCFNIEDYWNFYIKDNGIGISFEF